MINGFVNTFYQPCLVISVKTGILLFKHVMDPRLRGDDGLSAFWIRSQMKFKLLIGRNWLAEDVLVDVDMKTKKKGDK
jgi:hypothetical protein